MTGIQLQKILKYKEIRQTDIAKKLGITRQTLNKRLSKDDNSLSVDFLQDVANILKISLTELLTMADKKYEEDVPLPLRVEEAEVAYYPRKTMDFQAAYVECMQEKDKLKTRVIALLEENRDLRISISKQVK